MEIFGVLVVLLALLLFFVAVSLPFIGLFSLLFFPFKEKFVYWRYRYFSHPHNPDVIRTLVQFFPYYNKLDKENRLRFELRLLIFMNSKKFIARNGLVLTKRMKVLISASAIQLTFGFNYYTLSHFYKIVVYPESYLYRHYKVKFRGHVSEYGSIHLSWNNFEKGYLFPQDGVNLGLHELMHALKVYALQHHIDFKFHHNNEIIEKLARVEMVKYKSKKIEFLKNRLVYNNDEFLAVCAECFFELPQQFSQELPELFYSMKMLLNQDPLQPSSPVLGKYRGGSVLSLSS